MYESPALFLHALGPDIDTAAGNRRGATVKDIRERGGKKKEGNRGGQKTGGGGEEGEEDRKGGEAMLEATTW